MPINLFSNDNNKEEKEDIIPLNYTDNKKYINEDIQINKSNILVPLTNKTKENNCFLNVIIQTLFNLDELRECLLEKLYNKTKNDVVKELCKLIQEYKTIQEKHKYDNQKIEATLSVNSLRTYLNNAYGDYCKEEAGDPMETFEHILDLIHKEYLVLYPTKTSDDCDCPSHKYFFLDLSEYIMCKNCFELDIKSYDKNCYMFNIFETEISNILLKTNQTFDTYKLSLFTKIKEINKLYDNEKKIKISKCECTNLNYVKKLKLKNQENSYLIINITWADKYPNMLEILKIYSLLPMADKYDNLFILEEDKKKILYIKSIILYGIFHYIYVIYLNKQKRWGIVDDKTIKYIDKYYDLIDYLLRNHLMPVGLIYSQIKNDIIEENEINSNTLSNDDYKKLYNFCEEVEKKRDELKISSHVISQKASFNENNENYLENNLFYKSLLNLINSVDSDNGENNKKNEIKNNMNDINNKINDEKENKDDIYDIFGGRKYVGDFGNNNLKGGLIVFSSSYDDEDNENGNNFEIDKNESQKDEKEIYIGVKYRREEK